MSIGFYLFFRITKNEGGEKVVGIRPGRGIRPGFSKFELELKRTYGRRLLLPPPKEEIKEKS